MSSKFTTPYNLESLNLIKDVLDQIPDMFMVTDLEQKFSYANRTTARLFGYKNPDQLLGVNAHGMRCKAGSNAEKFMLQDRKVLNTQQELNLLDIHTYADDISHIFITRKAPIFTPDGQLSGTLIHCREVQTSTFQNISMQIAQFDNKRNPCGSDTCPSYQIIPDEHALLSKRELECLFYILRGKTMAKTAETLFISRRTVENHVANIKEKLNLTRKSDLIAFGLENGYLNIIPESLLRKSITIEID